MPEEKYPYAIVLTARVLFALLAIVTAVFIWFADNGVPNALLSWLRGVRHGDKYMHFTVYGLMAFTLHIGLHGRACGLGALRLPVAALAVLGLGLAEEITQLFSPRRQFEWVDLASNLAGVLLFTLLAAGLLWLLRRGESREGDSG